MNPDKFNTAQFAAQTIADDMLVAYWRNADGHRPDYHVQIATMKLAELAAAMGYALTPIATQEKVAVFLEELRDFKPDVISGRAPDPQDDVDDLTPFYIFEAFQSDAADLLKDVTK